MDDGVAIARRAARKLTDDFGPTLPALVERQLREPDSPPQRFTGVEIAIAAAALLVSTAQLAWQIYRDLKKDAAQAKAAGAALPPAPAPEAIAQALRLQVEVPLGLTAADCERMIAVLVAEVLTSDPER